MQLQPAPGARHGRAAVSALFLVNGALVANILPRLPAIKAGLTLSNAELGLAVAAMPIGGLLAGGFAGALIHRFGSGRLTVTVQLVYGLLLVMAGLAPRLLERRDAGRRRDRRVGRGHWDPRRAASRGRRGGARGRLARGRHRPPARARGRDGRRRG